MSFSLQNITVSGGMSFVANQATGSVLFNGTTQYLSLPAGSTALVFGTDDFTVEYWVYYTSLTALTFAVGNATTANGLAFGLAASGALYMSTYTTGYSSLGTLIVPGAWYHVAFVRSSGTVKFYLNGALNYTSSFATNITETDVNIGQARTGTFFTPGYISNLRIVKGVAVYTSAFAVPTKPLTATQLANDNGYPSIAITGTSTSLLMNTTNNSNYLTDSSSFDNTITNNNSAVSSALTPFKVGSILFNGTSQYLTIPSSSALQGIASGDMTIEFWIYLNSAWGTSLFNPIQKGRTGSSDYEWGVYLTGAGSNAGVISWQPNNNTGVNTYVYNSTSVTILPSQWYHVAICITGSTVRFFLNGVAAGTASLAQVTFTANGALSVTNNNNGTNTYFPGYMSNIRIVKGIGVYTSAFTPPAGVLAATQTVNQSGNPSAAITGTQTSLLLNTQNGPAYITDTSTYSATVTNNGAATSQPSNPFSL